MEEAPSKNSATPTDRVAEAIYKIDMLSVALRISVELHSDRRNSDLDF